MTIVLYHTLSDMATIGTKHLKTRDFAVASGSKALIRLIFPIWKQLLFIAFLLVAIGGVLIGLLFAIFTGLTTKFAFNCHNQC